MEVFHEEDERFNVGVGRTRDREYLLLEAGSHTTSETWVLEAQRLRGRFGWWRSAWTMRSMTSITARDFFISGRTMRRSNFG